jgi:hypothetical protein
MGLAVALAGCGGGSATTTSSGASHRSAHKAGRPAVPPAPLKLRYRSLYDFPAPLRDPAFAAIGGRRFVLIGGLDSGSVSRDQIQVADLRRVLRSATLPGAQHDAQGAILGGRVYVFGGGAATELDHIVSFDPATGGVRTEGSLPKASSDSAVTAVAGTAYVVGGYDGVDYLNTIVAWRPGSGPRVVAHLPVGLRYAAAVTVGASVLVIGGSSPAGASDAIYRFDPATDRVRRIGGLPHPTTHGAAAALGSFAYMVGGRGNLTTEQTASILSIDPRTGAVRPAGRLPRPLSDAGVVTVSGRIVVAGGLSPTGTVATVGELVPSG